MAGSVHLRQVFRPRLSDFPYEDVVFRGYDGPQNINIGPFVTILVKANIGWTFMRPAIYIHHSL